MVSISKLMAIFVIVAMLFMMMLGFVVGIQYQKQQPVNVDVISFTDGKVVNIQPFLYPLKMGEMTFISDDHYHWDRNVSFYAIIVSPV